MMPVMLAVLLSLAAQPKTDPMVVKNDRQDQTITFGDAAQKLEFTLDYHDKCVLTKVMVNGSDMVTPENGVTSGIKVGDAWYTTAATATSPKVTTTGHVISVKGIDFGGSGVQAEEDWTFTLLPSGIRWKIARHYVTSGTISDSNCPSWKFKTMTTWTGGLLGTGGVAWCKLFDQPNATYGVHTNSVVFWNRAINSGLSVQAETAPSESMGVRFTREPSGAFLFAGEPMASELMTKHSHARYLKDAQDVWAPWSVAANEASTVTYTIEPKTYDEVSNRGTMKGIDGNAVGDILNTIGRIGDIDKTIMGTNGWYSGFVCYHEPWVSQLGLAIDDPNYVKNTASALDFVRKDNVQKDGMVKSRWSYYPGDNQPGTYDKYGFYECQWGRLEDTQACYVMNVANEFNLSGDSAWLKNQKTTCEAALGYLLRRDTTGNHLVKMQDDTWRDHKSSDWLDIVWSAYESAYTNAQLFKALNQWAQLEQLMGDSAKAHYYRDYAHQLQISFNKPISQGGFWDPKNKWYVYWREKDNSIHGDCLVLPVNFMAIAYGVCTDRTRIADILDQTETQMKKEHLFAWPVNIYPYKLYETNCGPFPNYENGAIFLSWEEMGMAAYANENVNTAVKYVKLLLDQYKKDGLAYQRYLRDTQQGAGDDILAGNMNGMLGLYRDIYGIHPRYNRLFLAPRINQSLSGTALNYSLRGQKLKIGLETGHYTIADGRLRVESSKDFGVSFTSGAVNYFYEDRATPALSVQAAPGGLLHLAVMQWGAVKEWTVQSSSASGGVRETVNGLSPNAMYRVAVNNRPLARVRANKSGSASFTVRATHGHMAWVKLVSA